jgi:hypothetical protein
MRPDLQVAKCQEDEMNRIRGIRVVMGICAALAASSARADGGPFVGRWHWNRAQSKLPPGGPVPNDLTSEISRADSHVKWSVTILTTDLGTQAWHIETFEAAADGESHPISSDTALACRLAGGGLQTTFKGPAGESDTQTCTLSPDGKQMTCSGALTGRDGATVNYVDVYDRM